MKVYLWQRASAYRFVNCEFYPRLELSEYANKVYSHARYEDYMKTLF